MTTLAIAGVVVDEDTYQSLANIVATPDLPIVDNDGTTEVPATDLLTFLAKELRLDPAALTTEQAAGLATFIHDFEGA